MDTRAAILEKNFQAVYKSGFQSVRTDKVIADLGITKGAFYHYFPDKLTMGYALVDELLYPMFTNTWKEAQTSDYHAIDVLINCIRKSSSHACAENIALGCPLNNLVQEMSTIDENFRKKLSKIVHDQIEFTRAIIQKGIDNQQIKSDIIAYQLACFIFSAIEGSYGTAKSQQSMAVFEASIGTLCHYLNTLRA